MSEEEKQEWKKNWTREQIGFAQPTPNSNTFHRVGQKVSDILFYLRCTMLIHLQLAKMFNEEGVRKDNTYVRLDRRLFSS